jgi:hypothetical protein
LKRESSGWLETGLFIDGAGSPLPGSRRGV